MIQPPYLKKGDTIGIVCPAGYMAAQTAETCIAVLQKSGYNVAVGKTLGNQFHYFSGTDEERLLDLQAMLDNVNIKAILFGRGGYGLSRIIDSISFTKFKKNPKWLIGYSDITLLHSHINKHLKIATLHSPMAAAFSGEGYKNEFVNSLLKTIKGTKTNYNCTIHPFNKKGITTAELIGGNLSMLIHALGTKSAYNFSNKILFIEDVGEYIYNIDRMLIQLKRNGVFNKISGLIVGGFTDLKDTITPYGKNVQTILHEHLADYNFPVCFDFPVGHQTENYALKIGAVHTLTVSKTKVSLKENSI